MVVAFPVSGSGQGPGRWLVIHIKKCPDDEKYLFQFDIKRRKVNRTHDGFSGWIELDRPLDDTFGIRVDICKYVDGGCKPYAALTDESFCHYIEKYAKENVEKCFIASGLDLPICPVPQGKHKLLEYVFDYEELPEKSMYGLFSAKTYVMQDALEVACVDVTIQFDPNEDHDE